MRKKQPAYGKFRKSDEAVAKVIQTYNAGDDTFKLGDKNPKHD